MEKALNHTIGGVRGVYNRAEYSEQRRAMLQAWADVIDALYAACFLLIFQIFLIYRWRLLMED